MSGRLRHSSGARAGSPVSLGVAAAIGLLVMACSGAPSTNVPVSASPTQVTSQSPTADLAPYPPPEVAGSLNQVFHISLAPLSEGDRVAVAVPPQAAATSALASRSVGNPGPDATGEVVWTETGFMYLAIFSGQAPFGSVANSSYPAYLIQLFALPIKGFPGQNTALAIVDARSGELTHTYGPCVGELCSPH
jgi:hypothetical protein